MQISYFIMLKLDKKLLLDSKHYTSEFVGHFTGHVCEIFEAPTQIWHFSSLQQIIVLPHEFCSYSMWFNFASVYITLIFERTHIYIHILYVSWHN